MTWFYLRWTVLIVIVLLLAGMTSQHYEQHLASVSPAMILEQAPSGSTLRVQGMVESGSLTGNPQDGHAQFDLVDDTTSVPVEYKGPPPENLRELKTLIVIGQWDSAAKIFRAHDTALVTNYGFVVGAYLVGMIPLMIFLFAMSRKVTLLFQEIKQSKLYEPEGEIYVDQR